MFNEFDPGIKIINILRFINPTLNKFLVNIYSKVLKCHHLKSIEMPTN